MCQLVFFLLLARPPSSKRFAILPTPVSLTEQSGSFVLKDGMKIGVSDQSLFPAAGYLQEILRNVISSSVEVTTDKRQVDMYFQLKDTVGKPAALYKLESTQDVYSGKRQLYYLGYYFCYYYYSPVASCNDKSAGRETELFYPCRANRRCATV